ncbi:MAG: hypothetical protein ACI9W7_000171 [Porticoccaceae bacterium]|jgi:hypothetical protein
MKSIFINSMAPRTDTIGVPSLCQELDTCPSLSMATTAKALMLLCMEYSQKSERESSRA